MELLTGNLLVAAPNLHDPNFDRSVVLIVRHDEEGALGLILNRLTRTRVDEAWAHVSMEPCARDELLRVGGPCEGPLMILHKDSELAQFRVCSGVFFTVDQEHAEKLVQDRDRAARLFVGHSGWSPGQLEHELETGSWMVLPATQEHVFDDDLGEWKRVKQECDRRSLARTVDSRLIPPDPTVN